MKLVVKRFEELSVNELYDIMKLRIDIFVVEQNCPYYDLDDLDQDAIHVYIEEDGIIKTYLRVMDRNVESEYVSIGRVVNRNHGKGYGKRIMDEGIKVAIERFNAEKIYLEAQSYAKGFYEKFGFKQISDEFVMDDIPHIKMLLDIKNKI